MAANACINALQLVQVPTEEELPAANLLCPQASGRLSNGAPDSNAVSNTPGLNKSLGSCGTGALLSDMAALRRDKQQSRLTSFISDGTPSLMTESSLLATTTSTSARSSINASKYSSIPHGYLPVNDSAVEEERDMFSMDCRIPLGAADYFWFLLLGIDWLADKDSWGTMLTGMSSVRETFPLMIDGFELHPVSSESSLPFLTSNQVDKGFPQSAIMMFRYFHVKNKMNSKGAPQVAGEPTPTLPNKYNDDADFKSSNILWGSVRVCANENIKEAVESLSWDFKNTGIQVRWKPHQSADSSAQVQIFCCPSIFEREGLTKELIHNLKTVKKKLFNKGHLSIDLHDEPLPAMYILGRQNSQGRGQNRRERQLSLNNLEAYSQNGCLVLSIKMEEGTWPRFGPLWQMLNKMGLVRLVFGQRAVMVVFYGGKPTESDRNTIQRLHQCNVIYAYSFASEILPFVETIHKQVKVWMEDSLQIYGFLLRAPGTPCAPGGQRPLSREGRHFCL